MAGFRMVPKNPPRLRRCDVERKWHGGMKVKKHESSRRKAEASFGVSDPKEMKRKIIVHFHLYKNAGSTVDANLQSCYAKRWCSFEGTDSNEPIKFAELIHFAKTNPKLLAVSSHQVRPPVCNDVFDIFPIVFIRHPLDRLLSVYRYEIIKGILSSEQFPSLASYCEFILNTKAASTLIGRNAQSIFLSQANFNREDADLILNGQTQDGALEAIDFLLQCPVVGIVNRFEKSISKLLKVIPKEFHLSWNGSSDNIYGSHEMPLKIKLHRIKNEIGKELYDRLIEANKCDLALFEMFLNKLLTNK